MHNIIYKNFSCYTAIEGYLVSKDYFKIFKANSMQEKDLHEKFVNYLKSNYPNKKELTTMLSDILKIERESITRRLNDKVLFTIREMGKIAGKLNISVDSLIFQKQNITLLPLDLIMPMEFDSMDQLIDIVGSIKNILMDSSDQSDVGHVFNSLPVEFFFPYTNLSKFMYFKWEYYFVKDGFRKEYASWKIPNLLHKYHEELINCWHSYKTIFYIWDNSVIWNLVNEINYLYRARLIGKEDIILIKNDIHCLLDDIEFKTKNANAERSIDIYISSVNVDITCTYFVSPKKSLMYYKSSFIQSVIYDNTEACDKIRTWINSMKKMSTLITGSGVIEGRLFFDQQHKIIDYIF